MHRTWIIVMLMLSAFWQSVAMAGELPAFESQDDAEHALMHWHGEAHHHHDDGSLSQDDSDESVQHLMADASLSTYVLWTEPPSVAVLPLVTTLVGTDHKPVEAPVLDGPRRPPRQLD